MCTFKEMALCLSFSLNCILLEMPYIFNGNFVLEYSVLFYFSFFLHFLNFIFKYVFIKLILLSKIRVRERERKKASVI